MMAPRTARPIAALPATAVAAPFAMPAIRLPLLLGCARERGELALERDEFVPERDEVVLERFADDPERFCAELELRFAVGRELLRLVEVLAAEPLRDLLVVVATDPSVVGVRASVTRSAEPLTGPYAPREGLMTRRTPPHGRRQPAS